MHVKLKLLSFKVYHGVFFLTFLSSLVAILQLLHSF